MKFNYEEVIITIIIKGVNNCGKIIFVIDQYVNI
jgi:hypothetical protein